MQLPTPRNIINGFVVFGRYMAFTRNAFTLDEFALPVVTDMLNNINDSEPSSMNAEILCASINTETCSINKNIPNTTTKQNHVA